MERIANRSRELGLQDSVLLSKFVTERFLFRLSTARRRPNEAVPP